ncbi:heme-dependent oxidative N-demethylase family protein [Paracoccus aestuariivivens]|uniref:DUF3445 domain-containing protein n=1 Tax=Paracoccus aestuariivivens TaxID=1820333 RepID=A0A6L6J7Z0_9RHOB|nr:DUF3445 domain-containing protein [Paracoccus aestuariivivens]MTH77315.1 DUF3445 domain-containing protein [Paracoccus aestuariivivens]
MSEILQKHLGFAPWVDPRTRRLPGVIPVDENDWLVRDDAFAKQMELREKLITERTQAVHRLYTGCRPAADELYRWIMRLLPAHGYEMGEMIRRPDGGTVRADPEQPLLTLGRLVAEDLCLMVPGEGDEHILGGAILCFPAGWTLEQKFMRPMMRIHKPVEKYTEDIGKRVQRLLDGIRPGIGMMRGTAHHSNAPLHNPRTEEQGRAPEGPLPYIRVERQCLFRLPETGAVVFSIHTSVIREEDLNPEQKAALQEFPIREAA